MDNAPRPGETLNAFIRRRVLFRAMWLTVGIVTVIMYRWALDRDMQWTLLVVCYLIALVFVAGGGGLYDYLLVRKRIPLDRTQRPGETASACIRRRVVFRLACAIVVFVAFVVFRWGVRLNMPWTPLIVMFIVVLLMAAAGGAIYDYVRMRQEKT